MIRTTRPQVSETPTLAQQQADFTAEGSPPPGRVATSVPVTAPTRKAAAARKGGKTNNHRSRS